MVRLTPKLATIPAGAPIITPPASVAFNMSSMLNFFLKRLVATKVDRQLPVKEIIVLLIMRLLCKPFYGKKPALKDGQYIHKNNVPIKEKIMFP